MSLDQLSKLIKEGKNYAQILENIEKVSAELSQTLHKQLEKHIHVVNKSNFDQKALEAFKEKYWTIVKIPEMDNEYILVVPKMYDVNFGHLIFEDEAWRHFRVNQITNWISDIPDEIKKELNFKEPIDVQIIGNYLVGKDLDKVREMYPTYVKKEGNRLLIKPTTQFDLICKLLKNGTMPYRYDPIPENVLHHRDVTFELRDYQKEIIQSFKDHRHVTVIIPTSAGKTFVGMKAMSEVKGPYLIFVPTRTLVEQWKARIETYTNIPLDEVEIMTYQAGLKKEFTKKYGLAIYDECLTGNTDIILNDGGIEKITNIYDNNYVLGGKVSYKFNRETSELIKLNTSFGSIESTITHPHLVITKRKNLHKKQFFKIEQSDIHTVMAKDIIEKQNFLLVPSKLPHVEKTKWSDKQLAFIALIMGDGHIEKNKNVIKVAIHKTGKDWVRQVFIEGLQEFGSEKYWEFTNRRGDYTIGCSSKKVVGILNSVFEIPSGNKSKIITINNEIFYAPIKSIKKFIDIIFSCEGWISNNPDMRLCLSMTSKEFVARFQLLLKKFGIHSHFTLHNGRGRNRQYQITIGNDDINNFIDKISLSHPIKKSKLKYSKTRFLNDRIKFNDVEYRVIKVNKIEKITGEFTVYDFTTESHTFIANGFLTHNCHRTPADETWKLTQIPRECTLGMTATPFREDGREYLIVALSGYPFKLSWKHAKELGILKLPKCHVWVVKNADQKFGIMEKLLKKNVKTIIFCDDLNLGEKLSSKYGYPFVQGKTENRLEIIKKNLFTFASRVLDEGLSEVDIRQIIEVDWLGKSKRQSLQRVGRLTHGKDEDGKPVEGTHNIIMTLDEYIEDKQRIVVLADNGFETFYHIDDDPEMMEKIEKAEEKGYRKPRQHKEQKVRQPKPKVEPAPEVDLVHYPMLKHKGARNVYDKMAKGEREMFLFFIDPPNMDKKFTTNQLQFNLGYADPSGVWYAVQKLIKKKVVKKVGNTYMQCISELI